MTRNRAHGLLLLTSLIWGFAFVLQVSGMDHIHPFALNVHRNFIAGTFLLGLLFFVPAFRRPGADKKRTILGGIACGLFLAVAMALQQYGLMSTTAGKGGFITALYIVLVPVGGIVLKKTVTKKTWIAVALAALGLYFISVKNAGAFSMEAGDFLVFLSAICFAAHILLIDFLAPVIDGVQMSCIQFFVAGIGSFLLLCLSGGSLYGDFGAALPAILYLGFLSSGVGFTLQIVAQKYTEPTTASLILSLESLFALLGGVLFLSERMSARETLGSILLFIAIVLAQMPTDGFRRKGAKKSRF